MEPWPLAVLGALSGWLVKSWIDPRTVIPHVPQTCSCQCETPSSVVPQNFGWPGWLVAVLCILASITFGLLGFLIATHLRLGWVKHSSEVPTESPSFSKGKRGLGVTGKTLQLTGQ